MGGKDGWMVEFVRFDGLLEERKKEEQEQENVVIKTKGTGEKCDDGIKNN